MQKCQLAVMSEHLLPSSQVYAPTSAEHPFVIFCDKLQAVVYTHHHTVVQMQAHYMVRLLTQHACELPGPDLFQTPQTSKTGLQP